jgi:ADP-ribose pyrophosphatase YjhB (NUDIX family)
MEYFEQIRQKIGHDPLLLVGADIILYKDGKVLLQRRADFDTWGLHGGCLDLGETTEQAARRETLEEIGVEAYTLELYGVYSGKEFHMIFPNQDEVHFVIATYFCDSFSEGFALNKDEVKEVKWFDIHDLPQKMLPTHAIILADIHTFLQRRNTAK